MSERFFVAAPITGERAALSGDEARHLTAVMRAKVGDEAILFDGSGVEYTAKVVAIGKHAVELAIRERREISRELPLDLTLGVALPKGERQKWLVEKATELGVTRLAPLVAQRGVAQPVEAAIERLRRTVIEASKQCGRNRLMEIMTPVAAAEFFAAAAPGVRLLADPSGQAVSSLDLSEQQPLVMAVGPEGGYSDDELRAADGAGWQRVSLGPRNLRVETAAIALAAWAALR